MATLFGTTASGESLPVQVNEFGQLVAQGLPGPQGEQGEQGEVGPPGDFQFTAGTWTPEWISNDPSGAGFFTYAVQSGSWYLCGPLLTVSWYVHTTSCTLTDIRGVAEIGGLPPEISFATPDFSTAYAPSTLNYLHTELRGVAKSGRLVYQPERNSFRPIGLWGEIQYVVQWADLDNPNGSVNYCIGSFSGLVNGSVESVPLTFDRLV